MATKQRELVMSVTLDDCVVTAMRAGGPGGQNQNKVASAIRIVHPPSGAVGVSRTDRSQARNKQIAFRRMAETKQFQQWARMQAMSELMVMEEVHRMESRYRLDELKVEVLHGKDWVEVPRLAWRK